MLFSACFISVALLLIHAHNVGALSAGSFAVALAFWGVGGSLAFVSGLIIFARRRAAPSLEATAAAPVDTAARKRRRNLTLVLLTWALFAFMVWLLEHEFLLGSLSAREIGILGGCMISLYMVVAYLVLVFGQVKAAREQAMATGVFSLDPATREKRMFTIRVFKGIIAMLILGLLKWLSHAGEFPLWGTLLGLVINLGLMTTMVWSVVQLQKTLK
jgi:hypothetical protein